MYLYKGNYYTMKEVRLVIQANSIMFFNARKVRAKLLKNKGIIPQSED